MVKLFLGTNNFSLRNRLTELASQTGLELKQYHEGDVMPGLAELSGSTLFGPGFLHVFHNSIAKSNLLDDVESLLVSSGVIIIVESSSPKKNSALQQLLNHPKIEIEQFDDPQIQQLPSWLTEQAKTYGASITPAGAKALIAALVPEPAAFWDKPKIDLVLFHNELAKLAAYTNGKPITEQEVGELTKTNDSAEVWHVVNAMADKNSKAVFTAMEKFLSEQGNASTDAGKLILLNALLADQFRNLLLVQDLEDRKVPDSEILKLTGWKSGRLSQLRKVSKRFAPAQLKQILQKLENLDIELKTTNTPSRPILDLILTQVL